MSLRTQLEEEKALLELRLAQQLEAHRKAVLASRARLADIERALSRLTPEIE